MTLYSVSISLVVMLSCKVYSVWCRPSVPPMSGHLSCTDTFAWSRGCPFMTGTTVQVFAYCTIPQLLYYYDAFILGSKTIAYIIMTMHDIVFSINIAGCDVVV